MGIPCGPFDYLLKLPQNTSAKPLIVIVVSTGHATLVSCGFYQLLLHSTITAIVLCHAGIVVTEHPVVLIPPMYIQGK